MSIFYHISNNIGFIEFDQKDSKVNVLTAETLREFDAALEEIKKQSSLDALVILSRKKDVFIAGADIKEIESITNPKEGRIKSQAGQDIFNKLEDFKIPTVAVIDGVALGGGCELALACQYRLSTFNEKVRIGLPEVNLGILPGFGGTYRLPRVLGLAEGLKMILTGKPIDSRKALKIGLVDKLVPQALLSESIQEFIAQIRAGKFPQDKYNRRRRKPLQKILEESLIIQALTFSQAKKSVLQSTKGFYPAPLKALEVIKENYYLNRAKGLLLEAKAFGELVQTEICKNCIHVFYISEKYRKLKLEGAENISPQLIQKAAVLGAGVMGGGIAQLLSAQDMWVRLKDINYPALQKGLQSAAKIYKEAVKKSRLTKAEASRKMAHISCTLDYSGFKNTDMVIEAVVEDMTLKRKIFKELSEVTNPKTILASNTSALSVSEMARQTKDPSKVIGIHFFNPVYRMPLVEIITTPMTSPETTVTTLEFVKRLGKTPIVVKDSCGFLVNRILLGYVNEAGRILEESGQPELIDKLMTSFGMPMGPFLLSDEVGLDVGIKVLHILAQGLGERFQPTQLFEKIYEQKLFGKKSGEGFYLHAKEEKQVNPKVLKMFTKISKDFKPQEYLKRMLYLMINEAALCLEERIVDGPAAVDVGMIFGTGFPAFRGGLLKYADSIGMASIVDDLKRFEEKFKADRFKPCRYLEELKKNKQGFYNLA